MRAEDRTEGKNIFVSDIKERARVEGIFLITKKETALSKSGKPYLTLRLMDRTGEVEGRVWEEAEELSKGFLKDDFVSVKGWAVSFQGGIQVNISSIERYPEEKVSLYEFLPSSERDTEEMMEELKAIVQGIKDTNLKRLLNLFIEDEEISRLWRIAPAAKGMHHAYLGGLLEHTVSISRLAMDVAKHYRNINTDLLLTGTVLHDIGKIYELSYTRAFDYTDEGRLLGHITIGVGMVEKKIAMLPDFPEPLRIVVEHMMLSHHGHLEFGSPTTPKTVEAIMLYYLDDMDSKIQSVQAHIKKEEGVESNWTSYHRLYERHIYKGIPYLSEGELARAGKKEAFVDDGDYSGNDKEKATSLKDTMEDLDLFSQNR